MVESQLTLSPEGSRTEAEKEALTRRHTAGPSAAELKDLVVEAIISKKGLDVAVVNLDGVSDVADYFVVCTTESDLQSRAIVDAVKNDVHKACGERPWRMEGGDHRQWVLVDYVDVVVHVFDRESRSHYDLERLWGDATIERPVDGQDPRMEAADG